MPRAIPFADPVDVYIGQRLRAERIAREMTQTELGVALNVSFQQIQKYERGNNRISASMLVKAAEAFGLSVAELLPPSANSDGGSRGVDITTLQGGVALADNFATMTPGHRLILLQVAKAFARGSESGPGQRL